MKNIKSKKVLIIVAIAFIGLSLVGSTYAYLTMSLNVNNGTYNNVATHCFGVTYNAQNIDGSTDITGTLFPSGTSKKGLTGRVGFSSDPTCSLTGLGTINLNIANGTSSTLTTPASSYCESRSTLEPIPEYTTEAACTTAGERWRGYGDSYCEHPNTLERLEDYTSQSDCTSNGGNWTSGGSPLKYAVYTSTAANATPVSVGRITSSDIGSTVTIYNNFAVAPDETFYYIYIWLDGYLTDNTHTNLPFSATISASVSQNPNAAPMRYVYTANIWDANATNYNSVVIGSSFPSGITQYSTPASAMSALDTAYYNEFNTTRTHNFFLRHILNNNDVVTESYVGFVITPTMVTNNAGLTAGTYYLKLDDSANIYADNVTVLESAFGTSGGYCFDNTSWFRCNITGLETVVYQDFVYVRDGLGSRCEGGYQVDYEGFSDCMASNDAGDW